MVTFRSLKFNISKTLLRNFKRGLDFNKGFNFGEVAKKTCRIWFNIFLNCRKRCSNFKNTRQKLQ